MIPFLFGRSESVSLKGQASESFPKVFNRITGIEQGSDHHVPANAGKTVEVGNLHAKNNSQEEPRKHEREKTRKKNPIGFFRAFVVGFSLALHSCRSRNVLSINRRL
jgi:hypothetical protein